MNRKHAFQVGYFPYSLSRERLLWRKARYRSWNFDVFILVGEGVKHKMQVASPASQIHLIYKNFKMCLGCCSPYSKNEKEVIFSENHNVLYIKEFIFPETSYCIFLLGFQEKMNSFSFLEYFDAFELDVNVVNFVYCGKTRLFRWERPIECLMATGPYIYLLWLC